MPEYQRPLPFPTPETQPFWDACKRHELQLPYCLRCQAFFFYPRRFCPRCFSWDIEWRRCSGRGTLYTYAIQYRSMAAGFEPPYVTALVQLEEGPRLMTNLVDVEPDPKRIRCDMPVEVVFHDVTDQITLPLFRPAV
ncbi:MAG TPA: OB-fold domain-containing protein [Dehalococcoidia bacterium]|nr:OB-fold domain-containing protein [Dehalococcoidia bacterium]